MSAPPKSYAFDRSWWSCDGSTEDRLVLIPNMANVCTTYIHVYNVYIHIHTHIYIYFGRSLNACAAGVAFRGLVLQLYAQLCSYRIRSDRASATRCSNRRNAGLCLSGPRRLLTSDVHLFRTCFANSCSISSSQSRHACNSGIPDGPNSKYAACLHCALRADWSYVC